MKRYIYLTLILLPTFFMLGFYTNTQGEVLELEMFKEYKEYTIPLSLGEGEEIIEGIILFERNYTLKSVVETEKKEETEKVYVVKKGDSLYKISKELGVDMNLLILNNPHVKSGKINIGDELLILDGNTVAYKVEKGDSLIKIANRFNVSVNEIITKNNLEDSVVHIGQDLLIGNPDLTYIVKEVERQKGFRVRNPLETLYVTSPFGNRFHPVHKVTKFHKGVDLRARYVNLYAAAEGRVSVAGWVNGYGKLIVIKHDDGYETRYAHLNKIGVKVGERVKVGEKIGQTGNTGVGTAPHLHFEVRKHGNPLNPLKYIER